MITEIGRKVKAVFFFNKLVQIIGKLHVFLRPGKHTAQECKSVVKLTYSEDSKRLSVKSTVPKCTPTQHNNNNNKKKTKSILIEGAGHKKCTMIEL
jgi:hypothetical protein